MSDSKPYSGIPLDQRRVWKVPRWLKEAFVAVAVVSVAGVGVAKLLLSPSKIERAKSMVEAQDVEPRDATPIVLPARGGGTFDLAALRGKLVLVNFWATWCPPCREEMPSLARLASALDTGTFQLVAVSVDDGWEQIEKFLEKKPTGYPIVLDKGAAVSRAYGTSKYPETYLIDAQGRMKVKFVGPRDWSDPRILTLLEQYGARRRPG